MARFTAQEVFDEIDRQAQEFRVAPELAKALFAAENTKDGKLAPTAIVNGAAVSPKAARGVMQTLPTTDEANKRAGFLDPAHQFNPTDLRGQVRAGLAAIKEMQQRVKNPDDFLELATAYNGGTASHRNYLAGKLDALPGETRKYLSKVATFLSRSNTVSEPQQVNAAAKAPPATSSSTSSSVSTRTSAFDPEFLSRAIQNALGFISAGGAADKAINTINQAAAQSQAATQAQVDAVTEYAKNTGDATAAKTAVQAGEAARRASILKQANLDPSMVDSALNNAFSTIHKTALEMEPLGREIDQRQAVGLFDNPLEFLVNQVRLPGMVGQYNALARQSNRATEQARELQAIAGTAITQSQGMDADAILKAGVAEAAAAASQAKIKLGEIQGKAADGAVRDAMNTLAIQKDTVQTAIGLAQLTKQLMSENKSLSESDANKQAEQMILDKVNKYLRMIGSTQQYDAASWKLIPAREREALYEQSGKGTIGNSLSESLEILDQKGSLSNLSVTGDAATAAWASRVNSVASKNTDVAYKIALDQARITGKPVKRDELQRQELDKLQTLYVAELKDLRTASPENPYRIDYQALTKRKEFQDNLVTKYIAQFGPKGEGAFGQLDEKQMLDYFTQAVTSGQLTTLQASRAISDFYTRANAAQAEAVKYRLFGFPTAKGYKVAIPESGLMSRMFNRGTNMLGDTVDLASKPAVEWYLTRNAAQNIKVQGNVIMSPEESAVIQNLK